MGVDKGGESRCDEDGKGWMVESVVGMDKVLVGCVLVAITVEVVNVVVIFRKGIKEGVRLIQVAGKKREFRRGGGEEEKRKEKEKEYKKRKYILNIKIY